MEEWRTIISEAVEAAGQNLALETLQIYLSDDNIKEIEKLQLSPGPIALWETLEKGISILNCLLRTPTEIAELQHEELCNSNHGAHKPSLNCVCSAKRTLATQLVPIMPYRLILHPMGHFYMHCLGRIAAISKASGHCAKQWLS